MFGSFTSMAVSALDRIDECIETLPRRRMEMQSKKNRGHKFAVKIGGRDRSRYADKLAVSQGESNHL